MPSDRKLEISPTKPDDAPASGHPKKKRSGKLPKFFTFSNDHINQSQAREFKKKNKLLLESEKDVSFYATQNNQITNELHKFFLKLTAELLTAIQNTNPEKDLYFQTSSYDLLDSHNRNLLNKIFTEASERIKFRTAKGLRPSEQDTITVDLINQLAWIAKDALPALNKIIQKDKSIFDRPPEEATQDLLEQENLVILLNRNSTTTGPFAVLCKALEFNISNLRNSIEKYIQGFRDIEALKAPKAEPEKAPVPPTPPSSPRSPRR